MTGPHQEKPWGSADLAKAAGVSDSYVRRLCAAGKIAGAYKIGKTWLIPRGSGDQWLASRQTKWEQF
jgi:excisionase family DNA binding protein